jgi:hypothetical protein
MGVLAFLTQMLSIFFLGIYLSEMVEDAKAEAVTELQAEKTTGQPA